MRTVFVPTTDSFVLMGKCKAALVYIVLPILIGCALALLLHPGF